jgi:hypothetical protein
MSISVVKTWIPGEVLYAPDLNAEFANIITNEMNIGTPRGTGNSFDMNGQELILDADQDSSITVDTDDVLHMRLQGQDLFIFDGDATTVKNGLTFVASSSGANPNLQVSGEDTNIGMSITPKGTGVITIAGPVVASSGVTLGAGSLVFPTADGSAGQIIETDGSATLSFVTNCPRSYLAGLTMSNDTDASHDIAIAVGQCRDSTNVQPMLLSAILTKRIDATWAAGDNAGGLCDTDFASGGGDAEASTWYHVHLIKHADGTVDAGFDKSLTATELLDDSGYTYYRRIGSVLTDGAKSIVAFWQRGDWFWWDDPPDSVDVVNLGAATVDYAIEAPLDVGTLAMMTAIVDHATLERLVYISTPLANDEAPSITAAPYFTHRMAVGNTPMGGGTVLVYTDTSSQISARAHDADTHLEISVLGYMDRRGRDD